MTIRLNTEERLSDRDFKFLSQLVYDKAGIVLRRSKRDMVSRRLMRRKRALQIETYGEYCTLLKERPALELDQFINAITTNLTSFFREAHHFEFLESYLEQRIRQQHSGNPIRIWSAACSTGEEAYSLAITVNKAMELAQRRANIKILATDLDSNVLSAAKAGIYNSEVSDVLSEQNCSKWFVKGVGANEGLIRVKPELQQMIVFNKLNFKEEWPIRKSFDVIMCRNALIYFDKPTQQQLLTQFVDRLHTGGLLFLGHSERIGSDIHNLELKGRTIFQKVEKEPWPMP